MLFCDTNYYFIKSTSLYSTFRGINEILKIILEFQTGLILSVNLMDINFSLGGKLYKKIKFYNQGLQKSSITGTTTHLTVMIRKVLVKITDIILAKIDFLSSSYLTSAVVGTKNVG